MNWVSGYEKSGSEEALRILGGKFLDGPEKIVELLVQGRRYVVEHFCAPDLITEFAHSFNDIVRQTN
jgi:hypothetical protein